MPNLERQLSESPNLFMQVLAFTYKRSDDGEDPPEWGVPKPDATDSMSMRTHTLLNAARRVPGTRDDGTVDVKKLRSWIGEVRALCRTYAREVVGDHAIGNLLAKSPSGADGIWPCESVRQVLEEIGSKDIADGMAVGVYNGRGAAFRAEGGDLERNLATRYRTWSKDLAFEYPFVSALLEQIASGYDREAHWHDADADIRKRLKY